MNVSNTASVVRIVHVDGRAIPVREWERELTLRCAGWIAIAQATVVGASQWWGLGYPQFWKVWWKFGLCAALAAGGLVVVRARPLKIALAVVFLGCLAAGDTILNTVYGQFVSPHLTRRLQSLLPCCACLAGGVLLLRRRTIGRDLLLVMAFARLVSLAPLVYRWLCLDPLFLGSYYSYNYSEAAAKGPVDVLVAVAPPIFVLGTMLAGPGRALLPAPTETARLAPLSSLFRGGASLRAWGAVALLLATLAGSLHSADSLARWFGPRW